MKIIPLKLVLYLQDLKPISEINKEKEEQIVSVSLLQGTTSVWLILFSVYSDKNNHLKNCS